MPNIAKKQEVVQEIREKVERAKSVVLVDARGLTVLQDTLLRKNLREAGVDYKVYKNTMINFAIKDTDSEGLAPYLEGPTTMAFSYDDATKAAGLINKHLKDMPNLEFKAGVVEGAVYDAKGMIAIADIPSREVLLSRLLGSLKSPVSSFARVLNALAEEKEKGGVEPSGGGAAAEPEATPDVPAAEEAPSEAPAPAVEEAPSEAPAPAVEEALSEAPAPAAEEAPYEAPVVEETPAETPETETTES